MKSLSLYAQGGYFDREVNRPVQEKKDDGGYTYDLTYMDYNIGVGGRYSAKLHRLHRTGPLHGQLRIQQTVHRGTGQ